MKFRPYNCCRQWLWLFLAAEMTAVSVALAGMTVASSLTPNELVLVAVTLCSSSAGYYAVLFVHSWMAEQRRDQRLNVTGQRRTLLNTAGALMVDYGSAEVLDSLLFSPLLLYLCLRTVPNPKLAVVMSEVVSTVAFYATVRVIQASRRLA